MKESNFTHWSQLERISHINLLAWLKAKDILFAEVIEKLEEYFNSQAFEIVFSYKLSNQELGKLSDYIIVLKNLSRFYSFEDNRLHWNMSFCVF